MSAEQSNRSTRSALTPAGFAPFSGTHANPARHTPRIVTIASGQFGASTATFAPPGGIDGKASAARGPAGGGVRPAAPGLAQAERFRLLHLAEGCCVVHLGNVDVVGANPGLLVRSCRDKL